MAQKKDWKSGFEGRYRRTSSPSASPNRSSQPRGPIINNMNPPQHTLTHHSSTKCLNTFHNNYSALTTASMLSSSTMALSSYPSNASSSGSSSLSSSLSSSSSKSKSGSHLKHSVSSTSSSSNSSAGSGTPAPRQNMYGTHIKPIPLDNESHVNSNHNNNGWSAHARQMSTTVNFTSEELHAFRSRKPTNESYFHSNNTNNNLNKNIIKTLPSAISTPTLVQPTSYRSQIISSDQGSSTSLASATIDTSPKISPSTSLRASLDSLHCPRMAIGSRVRGSHDGLPRTVSVTENISSANESMSRSTSVAESLSRSTSIADSLCRRSSIAETASSLSRTSSISEPTAPSPTYLSQTLPISDGAVMARPATVTEEGTMQLSDQIDIETHDSDYTLKCDDMQSAGKPLPQSPSLVHPNLSSFQTFSQSSLSLQPNVLESLVSPYESEEPISLPSPSLSSCNGEVGTVPACDTPSSVQFECPATPAISPALAPPSSSPPPSPPCDSPAPSPTLPTTVTIGYGRSRRPEEVECDQLSLEYVSRLGLDPRLQALLGE